MNEEEKRLIERFYQELLDACSRCQSTEDKNLVRRALEFAWNAHRGARRKSGELFIEHPIEVAKIAAREIGLGTTSVCSALLHDVVEDSDYKIEDIKRLFGDKVAYIVSGLTKIKDTMEPGGVKRPETEFYSAQAENFRRMLMTISEDIRVVFIKIADRLHNMRTLDSMPANSQLRSAGETLELYAPLAHRLGLYRIKSELETLAFKYREPSRFQDIEQRINLTNEERERIIKEVSQPIYNVLVDHNFDFELSFRPKTVYSIFRKMEEKGVTFDEVYDNLAFRIVFAPSNIENAVAECWQIYAHIAKVYEPVPDRFRDWLSQPKANGYMALHCTVMAGGRYVEIQIRTREMDEVAERGFAAHWQYKGLDGKATSKFDAFVAMVKEHLNDPSATALDFLENFKTEFFSPEILVFTPKGELKSLPTGSTVLDFAFSVHTDIAFRAIGGKVNHKLVPLSYELHSGDRVEVLTSEKQKPQAEWLNYVITSKSKTYLKNALKRERREKILQGEKAFEKALANFKLTLNNRVLSKVIAYYGVNDKDELFYKVTDKYIDLSSLKDALKQRFSQRFIKYWRIHLPGGSTDRKIARVSESTTTTRVERFGKKDVLRLSETTDLDVYSFAACCNPIPGDEVIAYKNPESGHITIHKTNCATAIKLNSSMSDYVAKVEWASHKIKSFLARIKLDGYDSQGVAHQITGIISKDLNVNMRMVHIESHDGIFNGQIDLYVHSVTDLNNLILKLTQIQHVRKVYREEFFNSGKDTPTADSAA